VTPAQNLALVNGWLAAGGIAQVSWWAIDPAGGSTNPFPNILSDGDPVNTAWIAELASLAAQLKQVSGTVLFRPFLEMNGNWFWWGVENRTPAQYIQLWQQTHDYLVHTQGLTNLVFVYAVNAGGADSTFTDGYPGPTYVDVVGFDYYGNNPATDCLSTYQTLETLGKPIIIAEGGVDGATGTPAPNSGDNSQFITATKSAMPNIVAIMIWSQGWALDKQNGADAFLTDPWIIDRSGLPAGL
jgi:mannan endo-1,4-beta-mannosidase